MSATLEESKRARIDGAVESLRGRAGAADAAALADWVRQVYAGAPPRDLASESAGNLSGAALALWSFAASRKPGASKTRVYQPAATPDGWTSPHTIVETVNDDMPFLVDSVTAFLNTRGAEVQLIVHPVVRVSRDAEGRRTKLHPAGATDGLAESVMQLHVAPQPPEAHDELRRGLDDVLAAVRQVRADAESMRARLVAEARTLDVALGASPSPERHQAADFLRWLADGHFVLLGYRETALEARGEQAQGRIVPEASLGLARDPQFTLFDGILRQPALPAAARDALFRREVLRVAKASRRSPVHRAVPLDVITLPVQDDAGHVIGERTFVGLFPIGVYALTPRQIPLLAAKVEAVLQRAGYPPQGHLGKQLLHILETYPRDELFQLGAAELHDLAVGILHMQDRSRVALFTRRDPFQRFVSCLVYAPRDRFDSGLRRRFGQILEQAYGGTVDSFTTSAGDVLARVHFVVQTPPGAPRDADDAAVEARLVEAARSWSDRLQDALRARAASPEAARTLPARYAAAFPAAYREAHEPVTAAEDAERIEAAMASGANLATHLHRAPGAAPTSARLKVCFTGRTAPLSEVLPMLENMGLRVLEEIPYDVTPAGTATRVRIRDFEMQALDGRELDLERARGTFDEAFAQVWRGEMENDGFNRLILGAGLSARDVTVLRALCRYLRQTGIAFSQQYMEETLAKNADVARLLVALFRRRHDPAAGEGRDAAAEALVGEIRARLELVVNLDEDRILRRYLNLVECVLRTNAWQTAPDGRPKPYISFKLDSRRLDDLPLPRPFREIWVYSTRFEAIHLRGGKVARGGLRWSDRREDFRTEVLGLMKAQMVKNAVIVPVGSKGGFVLKQPPEGREDLQAEVVRCYRAFISGLLDLTDNLDGTRVVPPKDVVRRDEDDPYLVVAADKGTATFSDHANAVSADYGFWLDDAFASGGSAGYDHKAIAITARGGWESVKRHFREMGKDVQSQDTTCVGVGDMSGDVFGNAMLLSRHLKLLAAFDHRHIFVDPDPDPAESFRERERLFRMPRSAWTDYDAARISKGGGVFDRKAKSIAVTPQMRALFGLEKDAVAPAELMRAILKADVELLWFGGIGTFVKASHETHADAGDRSNDALRVDATEIRAKVVGEGANLALTQRARIELGLAGGRLNTDAIDNSGGVDCSDHEVNIKILLRDAEARRSLTREQRNVLLKEMTDEVSALVLRDNYLQTQAVTVTHLLSSRLVDRVGRFMRTLEAAGRLNRRLEALPDDETLRERHGVGLARPEICVLLAYAKIDLYDALLASDLPDDPAMAVELERYFPAVLAQRFPEELARHRLKREIVATALTNEIVNRVGITFVHEVMEKTGATAAQVARAYVAARDAFGMPELWRQVEALDAQVPALEQARVLAEAGRLVERGTVWMLREERQPLDAAGLGGAYREGVAEVTRLLARAAGAAARQQLEVRTQELEAAGIPAALAAEAASLPLLAAALDVVRLSRLERLSVEQVARGYYAVGERFGFDWLRQAATQLPAESAWDKQAVTAVVDELYAQQASLARAVLRGAGAAGSASDELQRFGESRRSQVARVDQLLGELRAGGTPTLAMLAVANRALKSLAT
jgi:glutamate dehydrogenase